MGDDITDELLPVNFTENGLELLPVNFTENGLIFIEKNVSIETPPLSSKLCQDILKEFPELVLKNQGVDSSVAAPIWDVDSTTCFVCRCTFSYPWPIGSNPKHHCRACGKTVCGEHSSQKVPLPEFNMKLPEVYCEIF